MQRGNTTKNLNKDGDPRIYWKAKKRDNNKIYIYDGNEENLCVAADLIAFKSSSQVENNQLDAAQRVLEALEERINNLDELRQRHHHRQGRSYRNDGFEEPANLFDENYYSQQVPADFIHPDHQRALRRAIEARKLSLDHYIEHSLKEQTGECDCHFEHEDNDYYESGANVTGVDCLCASQIECQGSLSIDVRPNCRNLIQDCSEHAISRSSSIEQSEESSYIGQELFIDIGKREIRSNKFVGTISGSGSAPELELVPQGLVDKREGVDKSTHCCMLTSSACCNGSWHSSPGQIRLHEIEREYSQRLTGFRKQNSGRASRISHEREDDSPEIGNALVESDTVPYEPELELEFELSDCESCEILRRRPNQRSGRLGGQLTDECSLTDSSHNNNEYNSPSSSSFSLSWTRDFLKTTNHHDISDQKHTGTPLINGLLPRSSSEGNIDSKLALNFISARGNDPNYEHETTDYNGESHSRSNSGKLRRQHSADNLGLILVENQARHYSSKSLSAASELDSERLITTANARGGFVASPASFEFSSPRSTKCCSKCQQHSIVIDNLGVEAVAAPATDAVIDGGQIVAKQSMKAVRDIAKMSVPSLSALQYLPSQIDQFKAGQSQLNMRKCNKMADGSQPKKVSNPSHDLKVIEEAAHDESCLFHRLCMCSCVSRQPLDSHEEDGLTRNEVIQERKISHKNRKSKKSDHMSSTDGDARNDAGSSSPAKESCDERQSPHFLDLLLLRPSSPAKRRHAARAEQQLSIAEKELSSSSSRSSSAPLNRADSCSRKPSGLKLGSDGNLVRSRASSAQEEEEDFSDTESGSLSLNRSPSSLSSSAVVVGPQRRGRLHDGAEEATRSRSACSTRPDNEQADELVNKSKRAYKRFLSPRLIFAHPLASRKGEASKSNGGLESLVEGELNSSKQTADSTIPKLRASFLSRSLTRLTTQRATRALQARNGPAEDNQEPSSENLTVTPDCCSPTISIDSPSSLSSPNSGQLKILTSTRPEIALNNVKFSKRSAAMTCSENSASTSPALSARHLMRSTQTSGEDQSVYLSEERALSLPPSPGRYRRHLSKGNRSPRLREFSLPVSTKIEDGLRVCSTEHFEKHIDNVKGNQDDIQAKLFKAWINHFHPNLIQHDLVGELRDGIKLIGLLASLTHDKELRVLYDKLSNDKQSYVNRLVTTPSSRLRHLSNVSIAIDYLRQKRRMRLVNLNPMDIVSGKPNVILGLCWNIILNFQLEQPSLFSETNHDDSHNYDCYNSYKLGGDNVFSSSRVSYCTSRLSNNSTNEDGARQKLVSNSSTKSVKTTGSLIEEYGTNDMICAKRKLLERINLRFNLKLTNLTSNLLDGDVLLAIIKRLVPKIDDIDSLTSDENQPKWSKMSNEEKLDCCFDIVETHLGIPRLFDGSDLTTKSSLIYLSMLLNTVEQTATKAPLASQPQLEDDIAEASSLPIDEPAKKLAQIDNYLKEIDSVENKFEIGQLDRTLRKIRFLEKLVESSDREGISDDNSYVRDKILERCQQLKEQADQIEGLIKWINESVSVLEGGKENSAKDLMESIEKYRQFFALQNLPKLETSLCPTLERQYRECLSSAKQRVLVMEQTLKNWISYEEARNKLRDWLITSETKLSTALNPSIEANHLCIGTANSPLVRHTERLDDLIEYFELESVDFTDQQERYTSEPLPLSTMMNGDPASLSGSLISLGSSSSRFSWNLRSSKKAAYHKLFDDFELKCRLLAAMLDRDLRESLLLGVRELRAKLRFITEQKVPQVVSDLRMSISRCEMSIQEQEDEESYEQEDLPAPDVSSPSEARSISDLECEETTQSDSAILSDSERSHSKRVSPTFSVTLESPRVQPRPQVKGAVHLAADAPCVTAPAIVVQKKPTQVKRPKQQIGRKSAKGRKSNKRNGKSPKKIVNESDAGDEVSLPAVRRIWQKLARVFRTSLPFNIVLLVCLAGLCAMPMIQKDACCGVGQQQIAATSNDIKPV